MTILILKFIHTQKNTGKVFQKELFLDNPVFGWIAQEVKNTYSDAVVVQKNTIGETEYEDFHYINKGKLYDLAVAGVKILHQRIKELENRIKVLEAK